MDGETIVITTEPVTGEQVESSETWESALSELNQTMSQGLLSIQTTIREAMESRAEDRRLISDLLENSARLTSLVTDGNGQLLRSLTDLLTPQQSAVILEPPPVVAVSEEDVPRVPETLEQVPEPANVTRPKRKTL